MASSERLRISAALNSNFSDNFDKNLNLLNFKLFFAKFLCDKKSQISKKRVFIQALCTISYPIGNDISP